MEYIKIPLRDQMLSGHTMACAMGPMVDLDKEAIISAIIRIASKGPHLRLTYAYDEKDPKHWNYDPEHIEQRAREMVSFVDEIPGETLEEKTVELTKAPSIYPTRFVVSQNYIYQVTDHSFADAGISFRVLSYIIKEMQGVDPELNETPEATSPLWKAFRASFGTSVKKIRIALDQKNKVAAAISAAPKNDEETVSGFFYPSPRLQTSVIDAATIREMNKAARLQKSSVNGILISAIMRRLESEKGIALETTRATYDLRRWLPEDAGQVSSNLIAAQALSSSDPTVIADEIETGLNTMVPLLAASVGNAILTVKSKFKNQSWHQSGTQHFDGKIRLTFSGMGVIRALEGLPYATKEPDLVGFTRPYGLGEITVNAIRLKGRLFISASFNDSSLDKDMIARVFDDVAAKPLFWAGIYVDSPAAAPAVVTEKVLG